MKFTPKHFTPDTPRGPMVAFRWDRPTALVSLAAALLCAVPVVGFLLAWHMQVELAAYTRWAIVPALIALGACEVYLVHKNPILFNRLGSGLVGGLLATLAVDAVRLPLAYGLKGMPDVVPLIGQHLVGETLGIAPTLKATLLGYGFWYLLVGALLGAGYALLLGKGHRASGVLAGLAAGLLVACLPQFQLLSVAEGFSLPAAQAGAILAATLGGAVLGAVVAALGRTTTNVLRVVFLRQAPVEAAVR